MGFTSRDGKTLWIWWPLKENKSGGYHKWTIMLRYSKKDGYYYDKFNPQKAKIRIKFYGKDKNGSMFFLIEKRNKKSNNFLLHFI